jgi:hypothetical protein
MPVVRSTADTCAGTAPNHFCANAATRTPKLDRIRRDLGLPEGCRLKAQLHNLLVYGPGQFFATHRDSEKADDMIGTLVVSLPSKFTGGALSIEHHEKKKLVGGSDKSLTFIAVLQTGFGSNGRSHRRSGRTSVGS